jgi:hypothetical protein
MIFSLPKDFPLIYIPLSKAYPDKKPLVLAVKHLQKVMKSTRLYGTEVINGLHIRYASGPFMLCPLRLSSHTVGIVVCLVEVWENPARRDKRWNYIALEIWEVHQTHPGHIKFIWACRYY